MIIFRYFLKEVAATWISSTLILMLIFMSTQFIHYLTQAAIGSYAASILVEIMMYQVPYLLGLLIPVGFYGAILLAYGRLYADREMIVFFSSGLSTRRLLSYTMIMALFVAIITAIFTLWISPICAVKQKELIERAKAAPIIESILPGRFFSSPDGQYVLYVEKITRDRMHLQNLFISLPPDNKTPNSWSILTAAEGEEVEKGTGQKYLVIHDGFRYQGIPGQNDYEMVGFKEYGLHLIENIPEFRHNAQMLTTKELFKEGINKPINAAEWQWRLSSPLSVFLLAFLALPLSVVSPRQGRFAKLIPATLIYMGYANLMFVVRDWIEAGTVSVNLGVWWIHGLIFLLGIILIMKNDNIWQRWWRRAS